MRSRRSIPAGVRVRSSGGVPTALTSEYYAQRASARLIITEGIHPCAGSQGHPDTAGPHSAEQVAAWREGTRAVHAEGGVNFAQLMHAGRLADPDLLPAGHDVVAPSGIAIVGEMFTHAGPKPYVVPRPLSEEEILAIIDDFAAAAVNAIESGFDGVEVHAAFGYLLGQFLATSSNQRRDGWGGDVEGRTRFVVETVKAVVKGVGADRVGVRISPHTVLNGIVEDDVDATYTSLVDEFEELGLAYLHVAETAAHRDLTHELRRRWSGTFILNAATHPEITGTRELELVEDGTTDLLAFGALFLANPTCRRGWRREGRSARRTAPPSTAETAPGTSTTRSWSADPSVR